jgi:TctA family transporter
MWIGNVMLVILNLPMIGVWIKLLSVPYRMLYPAILMFCAIGAFSVSNNVFEIYTAVLFGVLGYTFVKLKCEPAPLLLGFVLGPMMEENFRRTMQLSRGDPSVFVTEPLSAVLLLASVALIVVVALPAIRKERDQVFSEEEV